MIVRQISVWLVLVTACGSVFAQDIADESPRARQLADQEAIQQQMMAAEMEPNR